MIWTHVLPKSYLMNEETHGTYVKNAEAKLHVRMSWLPIETGHATYPLSYLAYVYDCVTFFDMSV